MKDSLLKVDVILSVFFLVLSYSANSESKVGNSTTMIKPGGYVEIYLEGNKEATVQFGSADFLAIRAKREQMTDGAVALRGLSVQVHVPKDPQARFLKTMTWQRAPGLLVPYMDEADTQLQLLELSNLICRSVGRNEAKDIAYLPDHKGWTRRLALGNVNEWQSLIFTAKGRRLGHDGFFNVTYETPESFLENYSGYQGVAVLNHLTCQ